MEQLEIENRKISNTYYNIAIERLDENDLYMATFFLKKSLIYNKDNIDSRNLLGLIFYRQGDVVEALVQWILSKKYNAEDNLAIDYIDDVQNDPNSQDLFNAVKIYNEAIDNIDLDRNDLAMMQLYKVLSLNPNHFKSLVLISILLVRIKEYLKAGSFLLRARKIDSGNFQANKIMNYVLANTKKTEIKEKRLANIYSSKK